MTTDRAYMVNIKDHEIVGTQSPDVPDGTYVRIDALPSAGGTVWNALSTLAAAHGEHIDSSLDRKIAAIKQAVNDTLSDVAHWQMIAATIRVNAMRHGATNEQIEGFIDGSADFIGWMQDVIRAAAPEGGNA